MRRRRLDLTDASDHELLAAHAQGHRDAFALLVHRHYDRLWQVAMRTSYTAEDAKDALQDALLSAHRNAGNFRGDAEVSSWLHRIVVNACLDRIRRNKIRPTAPLEEDAFAVARDDIAGLENSLVLGEALFTLPPEQRAAVVAVDYAELSVAEAAAMLGVAEGTIKSRCARGRERLREQLKFLRDPGNRI